MPTRRTSNERRDGQDPAAASGPASARPCGPASAPAGLPLAPRAGLAVAKLLNTARRVPRRTVDPSRSRLSAEDGAPARPLRARPARPPTAAVIRRRTSGPPPIAHVS